MFTFQQIDTVNLYMRFDCLQVSRRRAHADVKWSKICRYRRCGAAIPPKNACYAILTIFNLFEVVENRINKIEMFGEIIAKSKYRKFIRKYLLVEYKCVLQSFAFKYAFRAECCHLICHTQVFRAQLKPLLLSNMHISNTNYTINIQKRH